VECQTYVYLPSHTQPLTSTKLYCFTVVAVVVVVVECIYEPYDFSHSAAASSAECNCCSPLQLRLWAAVDNMWHHLVLATRAHVSCCKAPLLSTGCAVALVDPEMIHRSAKWHLSRLNPGSRIVGHTISPAWWQGHQDVNNLPRVTAQPWPNCK